MTRHRIDMTKDAHCHRVNIGHQIGVYDPNEFIVNNPTLPRRTPGTTTTPKSERRVVLRPYRQHVENAALKIDMDQQTWQEILVLIGTTKVRFAIDGASGTLSSRQGRELAQALAASPFSFRSEAKQAILQRVVELAKLGEGIQVGMTVE